MAIKVFKPTSPGRRFMTGYTFDEITKTKPEKSLVVPLKKKAGRNNQGKITVRHRGGGAKRMLRLLDFKRDKVNVPGEVISIEYDPNRTARIALIRYEDGEKRYILAPVGLKVGARIIAGSGAELSPGNALPLGEIPSGTLVHALELQPGKGAQVARGAGAAAQVLGREGQYTMVRMPSGEIRKILSICKATIGQVGNIEHQNISLGKAGRSRWLGRRPKVRGSAMSPRDHPHGGGEGRTGQGMNPKTPTGRPALGRKTRKRAKPSDRLIVKRRK